MFLPVENHLFHEENVTKTDKKARKMIEKQGKC